MKTYKKTLSIILGGAVVTSLGLSSVVNATDNPFIIKPLTNSYQVADANDKTKEGKCGEGKCGAENKNKDTEALVKKSGCLMCHAVDKKILGPSYKDVAAKYKGQKDAEDKLVDKVKKGGSGVWGAVPMPANSPKVSDDDIRTIIKWILIQK